MTIAQRLTSVLVFACLACTALSAQVPSDLQQAIRQRQRAVESADGTTWDRLTAKEFTVVGTDGRLLTKAERLAALKQQKPQTTPTSRSQEQIQVHGNTAIERVRSGNLWVIQVWVKQPQGWQVVATQLTTATQ
jgi:uncharacterized protein DUF4440